LRPVLTKGRCSGAAFRSAFCSALPFISCQAPTWNLLDYLVLRRPWHPVGRGTLPCIHGILECLEQPDMLWQVTPNFIRINEFGLNDKLRINEKRSPEGVTRGFIQHLIRLADFLVPVA
jgi:hypothetical protein